MTCASRRRIIEDGTCGVKLPAARDRAISPRGEIGYKEGAWRGVGCTSCASAEWRCGRGPCATSRGPDGAAAGMPVCASGYGVCTAAGRCSWGASWRGRSRSAGAWQKAVAGRATAWAGGWVRVGGAAGAGGCAARLRRRWPPRGLAPRWLRGRSGRRCRRGARCRPNR